MLMLKADLDYYGRQNNGFAVEKEVALWEIVLKIFIRGGKVQKAST